MKTSVSYLLALALTAVVTATPAATVTVTVVDDGVSNIGASGTLYWAITNCNAGDTIAFNIPGGPAAGPHYFQVSPYGFPLIYKKANLTIDGYTQPGSSRNTNPITNANNAVIKIVLDGRNGFARDNSYLYYDGTTALSDPPINNTAMVPVNERTGYGNEWSILSIYRSTNVTIRGLAILANEVVASHSVDCIALPHDFGLVMTNRPGWSNAWSADLLYPEGSSSYAHINGCWFGVDPTNQTRDSVLTDSPYRAAISHYRHRTSGGGDPRPPNLGDVGITIGVKKGSANPRAEFNVIVGGRIPLDGENLRSRCSGNFFGVLPDGVTDVNIPNLNPARWGYDGFMEWGRYDDTEPMIIGTDGDGVNDADEGNLFGPLDSGQAVTCNVLGLYNTANKPYIIAGNRFGIAVDGTIWPNNSFQIGSIRLDQGTQVRFGTDGNGVSDALEANYVYNNNVFASQYPSPASTTVRGVFSDGWGRVGFSGVLTSAWISVRGNVMVDNMPIVNPEDTAGNNASGRSYMRWWTNFMAFPATTNDTIPTLSGSSTLTTLIGTTRTPTNGYTNLVIDVYLPDPDGLANGIPFGVPTFPAGFVQGKKLLGSFLDNGPYDSNPTVGAFSLNISGLGLTSGTKVTIAVTYSSFGRPSFTSISHVGTTTTLVWTNPGGNNNGGPIIPLLNGAGLGDTGGGGGGATSGFGVQRAPTVLGPWTTIAFAPGNTISVNDPGSMAYYRVIQPISGMTTLCAVPVTLP